MPSRRRAGSRADRSRTVFSAGVDLHRVIAGRDAYLASFLPELRKVFTRLAHLW